MAADPRGRVLLAPIRRIALAAATLGLLAGPAKAASSIDQVLIVSETTDSVVLEVRYSYDGRQGEQAFASARMTSGGKVVRHFGYRPGAVQRGRGRTRIQLSAADSAPPQFRSDGVRVELYTREGAFASTVVAFAKTWAKPGVALEPQAALRLSPGLTTLEGASRVGGRVGADDGGGGEIVRRILPGGKVELRYPDGAIVQLTKGSRTVIPAGGGPPQVYLYQSSQPPTPPAPPPGSPVA
ncbi:MAG: hypothetical protein RIM80_24920, partial [Alphaproteobacteria bacterium]